MLGLMGAMEDEVRLIREDLDEVVELDGPCELLRGRLDGTPVVLAKCGIGKVNAALAASAMVQAGATSIVFTGVAGAVAPGLGIGDVVVGDKFRQHDADDTAFGNPIGIIPVTTSSPEPSSVATSSSLRPRRSRGCAPPLTPVRSKWRVRLWHRLPATSGCPSPSCESCRTPPMVTPPPISPPSSTTPPVADVTWPTPWLRPERSGPNPSGALRPAPAGLRGPPVFSSSSPCPPDHHQPRRGSARNQTSRALFVRRRDAPVGVRDDAG